MNIAIDSGNTITKVGIFEDENLQAQYFFKHGEDLRAFLSRQKADNIIVSSVTRPAGEILNWVNVSGDKIALTTSILLPITIKYKTPATLGVDRIAAVCGALHLMPGKNCVVIDAGTCITFEFLDHLGVYHGGSISPGVQMRFAAMHELTARLPLVAPAEQAPLIGDTTESCMQSGVMNGVRAEIVGIIHEYRNTFPDLIVVVCGGDARYLENALEGANFVPELVLIGLNRILRHNATV